MKIIKFLNLINRLVWNSKNFNFIVSLNNEIYYFSWFNEESTIIVAKSLK